ncbi:MAG TPA: glycosyltransferase [Longimicrobiales bacterium]|nr:glycosyltransferase [Longimicrobiales bacterium]
MRRVSILMPCRDAAPHLPAAIASLRAQTFDDFEVLAVDDGSADRTGEILHAWAREDGRVRVMQGHGRGLVPALATAHAGARAELVARMDADDLAAATRLEKQVALMDADPGIAACGTGVEYFPAHEVRPGARRYEAWINALLGPEEIARDIFIECPIPHPTLMIRRNVLQGVGGYRELGWPEDYDLILRVWAAGYRMAKLPDVLHRWREGPERASRTDSRYSPAAFLRLKIHFLTRTLLAGGRPAVVWGAGPIGKRFALALIDAGTPVAAFVEVDRKKIGQEIHRAPVVPQAEVRRFTDARDPRHPGALVLAAVGQEGAREEIRASCRELGLREGLDFVAVA